MTLKIVPLTENTAALWAGIHNRVIPAHQLSESDVRERMSRHRLTLGYDGRVAVGNATLRPPTTESRVATVIVRVLPEFRGRGYGTAYAEWGLSQALILGSDRVETVVLAANEAGLRFAQRRGFVEFDRYTVDAAEYVDLWLAAN